MRQGSLQGETDGQTDRAEDRDDAGGLDAELGKNRDKHKGEDRIADNVGKKGRQRVVHTGGLGQRAARTVADPSGQDPANNQDDNRADYVQRIGSGKFDDLLHCSLCVVCHFFLNLRIQPPRKKLRPPRRCH